MSIDRRNFLFGTVAAAASGTALVLSAPKEALQLFQPTLKETLALTRKEPASHFWLGTEQGQFYLAVIGAEGIKHEMYGWTNSFSLSSRVESVVTAEFDGRIDRSVTTNSPGRVELSWNHDYRQSVPRLR